MKQIVITCTDKVMRELRIYLKMRLHKGDIMDVRIDDLDDYDSNKSEWLI